jgi:hypothetical protein
MRLTDRSPVVAGSLLFFSSDFDQAVKDGALTHDYD